MDTHEQKIIKLVSSFLGVELEEINSDSHFFDDLNVDKMTLADLYLSIETEFGIKFDPAELEKIQTVGDLVKLVEDKSDELI
jgi:acyl carrier protein